MVRSVETYVMNPTLSGQRQKIVRVLSLDKLNFRSDPSRTFAWGPKFHGKIINADIQQYIEVETANDCTADFLPFSKLTFVQFATRPQSREVPTADLS